jgi:folate-binding protein YgfZ
VICEAHAVAMVWAELKLSGAVEVGEDAVECVRIEQGRPRFGVEIDDATMPQEAGIHERAVSYTKGCYVGQETVARLYWKGKPNRHLRGLRLTGPATREATLHQDGNEVGRLGSVAISPALGPIGLALVRREAGPGDVLVVNAGPVEAEVVETPF